MGSECSFFQVKSALFTSKLFKIRVFLDPSRYAHSHLSLVRILAFSGAVSSSPNAIALIGSNGRYLTADQARGASDVGAIHVTMDQYL
jgi:hypothetical protein